MQHSSQELDKMQIATQRLADTICGYFSGNHEVTTVANARAVLTLVRDIRNHYFKHGALPRISLLSEKADHEGVEASVKRIINLSNFSKHADTDCHKTIECLVHDDSKALFYACVDFDNLLGALAKYDCVDLMSDYDEEGFSRFFDRFGCSLKIQALIDIYVDWVKDFYLFWLHNKDPEVLEQSYVQVNALIAEYDLRCVRPREKNEVNSVELVKVERCPGFAVIDATNPTPPAPNS